MIINASPAPITMERITHRYGALTVLEDITLEVKQGEILVIVGPSGCGKTTLLSILAGYLAPTSGRVNINGAVRTVYQQGSLFPWLTVAENIGIGLRSIKSAATREQEIKDLLSLINMHGFEDHYPHQLSGGMKQRVELARVLAGNSDIILMDEPFSSLDYIARIEMRRELSQLLKKRPKTVVMVTHDIEEAVQIADRIIVLSKRPSSISWQMPIQALHPRSTTHPELIAATEHVIEKLGLAVTSN